MDDKQYPGAFASILTFLTIERLVYYGFRANIVLFLVATIAEGGAGMEAADALEVYGAFTAASILLVIAGGLIADLILGSYKTLWIGALTLALGYGSLFTAGADNIQNSLMIIALGTGLFKPNIIALLGLTIERTSKDFPKRFAGIYFAINVGALLGSLFLALLADSLGYSSVFICCSALMGVVVLALASVKHVFPDNVQIKNIALPSPQITSKDIVSLILIFKVILLFWCTYEVIITLLYQEQTLVDGSRALMQMASPLAVLVFGLLVMIGWSFMSKGLWLQLALALVIGFSVFAALTQVPEMLTGHKASLLVTYAWLAIGEVLLWCASMTLLMQKASRRALTSTIAVTMLASYASSRVAIWAMENDALMRVAVANIVVIAALISWQKLSKGKAGEDKSVATAAASDLSK